MAKNKKTTKNKVKQKEEILKWEDLLLARDDANKAILEQQLLISELIKVHEKEIENDPNIIKVIEGLLKTLEDLAKDSNTISLSHATEITEIDNNKVGKKFKKGLVPEGEDQMKYIQIATQYLSIVDKVAHLAGTAYLDIFTKLKVNTNELKSVFDKGKSDLDKINKEILNGK